VARKASTAAKVAHVGPHPRRIGGMEAMLRDLLASPLATRYQLDLIASYRTHQPVRRLLVFAGALVSLARWCRGDGPRIVHIHSTMRGSLYRKSLCVAVAATAGRPVVLQLHTGVGDIDKFAGSLDPIRRAVFRAAMRRADVVACVSSAGARRIEENFGVKGVIVVPNPAPAVEGVRAPAASAAQNGTRPRALYIGGFSNPAKGGHVLLRALPEIIERCPELDVTLAGSGTPPDEITSLQRSHPGVHWAGWLDQRAAREQVSQCDVFLMPSISEGLPIALLEAMAFGRAIVATKAGGIPEAVEDDAEAILVPPADPEAFSAAVLRAVRDDRLRARLGSAAQARLEKDFGRDEIFDRIAAIYDELLAREAAA
jgi:glycosyltransferase involved in cell wall biosynthesis